MISFIHLPNLLIPELRHSWLLADHIWALNLTCAAGQEKKSLVFIGSLNGANGKTERSYINKTRRLIWKPSWWINQLTTVTVRKKDKPHNRIKLALEANAKLPARSSFKKKKKHCLFWNVKPKSHLSKRLIMVQTSKNTNDPVSKGFRSQR